jgi:hypothetical protein
MLRWDSRYCRYLVVVRVVQERCVDYAGEKRDCILPGYSDGTVEVLSAEIYHVQEE